MWKAAFLYLVSTEIKIKTANDLNKSLQREPVARVSQQKLRPVDVELFVWVLRPVDVELFVRMLVGLY